MRVYLSRADENYLRRPVMTVLAAAGLADLDAMYSTADGHSFAVPDASYLEVVCAVDPGAGLTPRSWA